MNRRRAFQVVDLFEEALAEYTGAPYAVTVDSCTNAIFLSLSWFGEANRIEKVEVPKHTYIGVVQAIYNSGNHPKFTDQKWEGSYWLKPFPIVDSAKRFERDMYQPGTLTCLSFQAGKHLPIGRGGAILTDDKEAADWLKKARLDGRTQGADYHNNTYQREGHHMYMTPPDAARGLWLMTYLDDNDKCDWTEYPDLSEATWS